MALTQVSSGGIADGAVTTNDLENSGVTAGTYGSSSAIPAITVDAKGRVTSATTSSIDSTAITNGTSNVSVANNGDITATRAGTERWRAQSNGVKVNNNVTFTAVTGAIRWPEGSNANSRQWDLIGDQGANGRLEFKYGGADGASPDEIALQMNANGETSLWYDNAQKLATKSDGIDVTGEVQCDSLDVDGAVDILGHATFWDDIDLQDDDRLLIGSGDDLVIQHTSNHSYIDNNTGDLYIQTYADNRDIFLKTDNGSGSVTNYVHCDGSDGAVRISHYGSEKLATTSSGVNVTGTVTATDFSGSGANLTGIGGTILQTVQHTSTDQINGTLGTTNSSAPTSTSGTQFTSFTFTPQSANSTILLMSSTLAIGETSNNADVLWAGAWAGTTRIVVNHTGLSYARFANNYNSAWLTLTGQIDSWGTAQRTISIRVGVGGTSGSGKVVNIDNTNNGQSTGARDVKFIMMEIA